jgi:hypothetical protein
VSFYQVRVVKLMPSISIIPKPTDEKWPFCPTCGATMRLVWISPETPNRDRNALECRSCGEAIEVIVERTLET